MVEAETAERLRSWLPPNAVIDVVADRDPGSAEWRARVPAFLIEVTGTSRRTAVEDARNQLLIHLLSAERHGKSFEEAATGRRGLQTIALLFTFKVYLESRRGEDATWLRLPGESFLGEGWDLAAETAGLLSNEEAMAALREADADLEAGRVEPYEDVRRDLGLG
jgi:hypothetical protein